MKYNLTPTLTSPLVNLRVSSIFDVSLQIQNDQDNFLELDCPEQFKDKIEISYKNGTLVIGTKNIIALKTDEAFKIVLKAKSLESIEISGVSSIVGTCFVPKLSVDASGTSTVKLSGVAQSLNLELSGTSEAHLSKFHTEKVKAKMSGVSNAKLVATKECFIAASGVSKATVEGNPANCRVDKSGVAEVKVSKTPFSTPAPIQPASTIVEHMNAPANSHSKTGEREILEVRLGDKDSADTPAAPEARKTEDSSLTKAFRSIFRR